MISFKQYLTEGNYKTFNDLTADFRKDWSLKHFPHGDELAKNASKVEGYAKKMLKKWHKYLTADGKLDKLSFKGKILGRGWDGDKDSGPLGTPKKITVTDEGLVYENTKGVKSVAPNPDEIPKWNDNIDGVLFWREVYYGGYILDPLLSLPPKLLLPIIAEDGANEKMLFPTVEDWARFSDTHDGKEAVKNYKKWIDKAQKEIGAELQTAFDSGMTRRKNNFLKHKEMITTG
tara:strand:+ start:290 stop:985 length:696 start_codon:yes stop_codon:yes gene_type:complete